MQGSVWFKCNCALQTALKQLLLAGCGMVLIGFGSLAWRFMGAMLAILAVWWVCENLSQAERSRENLRACRDALRINRARRLAVRIENQLPVLIPLTSRGRTPQKARVRSVSP